MSISKDHTHKKRKDSLQTRVAYAEVPDTLQFIGPTHRGSFMKNMANSEGYTSNCEEVQLEMNLHTSRILFSERFQP